MTDRFIEMGQIVAAHGIKGEVKITPFCKANVFASYAPFYDADGHALEVKVKHICKNQVIALVNDVCDRNTAETLRGTTLFVEHKVLPKLKSNEYYVCDLIGLDVIENSQKIGRVTDVLNYGASDILQIKCEDDELLLAMCPSTVLKVDLENRQIEVAVPQMVEGEDNES
ncbi:MAG: 16S rRNA processing protein RimM [Alphaproteobacteria bacterium]|nr:16S rRNA processing protein RimM [Alphaproteobacteria bacterium]